MNQARPVLFVGAGPGDPDLITVAGRRALEEADLVVFAGSLVSPEMLGWCRPEARRVDSAGLDLEHIVETMAQAWQQGERVVRLHTGDPSLYGAVAEQFRALNERGVPYRVIPGVSAAFAAAAALGLEFTIPEKGQSLILTRMAGRTPVPAGENLAGLAGHGASLAIYLSVGQADKIARDLDLTFGPQAPLVVAYRVSWPDEKLLWTTPQSLVKDLAAAGIDRQALILAGPGPAELAGDRGGRSRLYDASFSHGFRRARQDAESDT